MDFTREPIIETIITPKEGHKLVVRSSKTAGQEEFFVDALEVVCFGNALFFRSLEKPKSFLVPTSDYEVLEVRETRMVLKHVGVDRAIKIGGGKEAARPARDVPNVRQEQEEVLPPLAVTPATSQTAIATPVDAPISDESKAAEARFDRKRDRRRHYRRRRGREDVENKEEWNEIASDSPEKGEEGGAEEVKIALTPPPLEVDSGDEVASSIAISTSLLSSLLPPPPTLISETIAKYRDSEKFKGVFFGGEEKTETTDTSATKEKEIEESLASEVEQKEEELVQQETMTEEIQQPLDTTDTYSDSDSSPQGFVEAAEMQEESPVSDAESVQQEEAAEQHEEPLSQEQTEDTAPVPEPGHHESSNSH